ncbi:S1-C subfamily serine protease [Streptomyces puniciscabiei]|uniref:S1-C subfamily serine protease n=1 Tax=Streptomyces puniciscabiei TaxID=164348 RepID=A0A542UKM6_9ACTN|nr:trypsin-like peptidase domain-containing protein [Streptomyces puniciscabiei]TQK99631.1 S1-C subfamily serine protease [Streptomyces puniciscabiei]
MDASPIRALRRVAAAAALVCCVAASCSANSPEEATATAPHAVPMAAGDLQSQYQRVIKEALPSVVQIQAGHTLGSGVVYDGKGHIVTNAHVVESQKTFKVTAANSQEPLTARLVYSYPAQDLAVIKLDRVPAGLRAARFGDTGKVQVGQIVLAMGSPLGLSSSVTQGIVSATGRTVSEVPGGGTGATLANMVQTSAAINPGNSGGALVDLSGRVIGIPTLAAADPALGGSAAPGIGFAIPASMVKTIAGQIVKEGRVTDSGRAALGITGRTVLDDRYRPIGVAVVSVKHGGAADRAGLRPGDIITKLGDRPITTITSLSEALAADTPGRKTSVTYQRDGARKTVEVTLGEQ